MFTAVYRFGFVTFPAALACAAILAPQPAQAQSPATPAQHAMVGEVMKVDAGPKTVVIRKADGGDEKLTFTERTTVQGVKDVGRVADPGAKAGLEHGAVVIYYTGGGVERTAVRIDFVGKRVPKLVRGSVIRVDDALKFVVIKTTTGAEETFELTKDTVVDRGAGIGVVILMTGDSIKQGAEVAVHYSDEGGKKLVLLLQHI